MWNSVDLVCRKLRETLLPLPPGSGHFDRHSAVFLHYHQLPFILFPHFPPTPMPFIREEAKSQNDLRWWRDGSTGKGVFCTHTHEDLCLSPQHPHKSLIWGFSPITPAVRGVRRGEADAGSSLASQSSRNSQLQIQRKSLSQERRWRTIEVDT